MNGYTVAVWSTLILAELLLISAGLNIFFLRWRGRTRVAGPPPTLLHLVGVAADKAQAIRAVYRQMIGDLDAAAPSWREDLQTHERELEELFQSRLEGDETDPITPYATLLQPVWTAMQESHALLLDTTQRLQALTEKMITQERLAQELTELSTTYQRELDGLFDGFSEDRSMPEVLEEVHQRHLTAQATLHALEIDHQALLQEKPYHGFVEQHRSLFEALQTLKLDGLRSAEKARTQESQMEELRGEKVRLEGELERLKGVEDAHGQAQLKTARLEEQFQHAEAELQELRGELTNLTAEYLKLFEQQKA